jgi:hypothetical protein
MLSYVHYCGLHHLWVDSLLRIVGVTTWEGGTWRRKAAQLHLDERLSLETAKCY